MNKPENGGSFYLQSKIFRAMETLEYDLKPTVRATQETMQEREKEKQAQSSNEESKEGNSGG
jgi:hypothetical protein